MVERVTDKDKTPDSDLEGLKSDADSQKEVILKNLDKAEKQHRRRLSQEKVLAEATELAKDADEEKAVKEKSAPTETLHRAPSKKQRAESFSSQMKELRNEMTPGGRIMSKIMHNPVVERVSDIAASTVARPNAMLSGSISAFICITGLYFIARYYGYHLSGFETVFAFALGWVVGILYDYIRALTGNHSK